MCGKTEVQDKRARPDFWADLTLARDAYDYQGYPVADGTVSILLCGTCADGVVRYINERKNPK